MLDPQHRVTIAHPFAVGKFEVTFAEWDACVAQGGCTYKPGDEGWGRGKHPVIYVTWQDATQYTSWLSKKTGKAYRLLSEAEWEYAARGTTKISDPHTPFSTGPTINYRQANYDANFTYGSGPQGAYRQKTLDVGSLPRNAFGLYDMAENVHEWCNDWYRPDTYRILAASGDLIRNPKGPSNGYDPDESDTPKRVQRGGSFLCSDQYCARYMVGTRGKGEPDSGSNHIGFRCVQNP